MARIRSLKPGFCTSEKIAALSIPARLHFAMLWTYADDAGRGVDHPKLIKAALWPLDDDVTAAQVDEWQNELERKGRLLRYEVDGKRFFEIQNFEEHQHPQHPKKSEIPEPSRTPHEASRTAHEDDSETLPVVVEVVGEVEGDVAIAPAPRTRMTDPLWDALMAECGVDTSAIPQSARGAYNKALKSLKKAGATPEQVPLRAQVFRTRWPGASVTPTSLDRRWAECDPATHNIRRLPRSAGAIQAAYGRARE